MTNGNMSAASGANTKSKKTVTVATKRLVKPHVLTDDLQHISRNELEAEVARLRLAVKSMKQTQVIDEISGLSSRPAFLNHANSEFNRSRRYGHDMTLCVTDIVGFERIGREFGDPAADHVMTCISQMCLSSSRFGVDVLGRISDNQIAILLPETPLAGGLAFLKRMQQIVREMPLYVEHQRVRPGLKVSADALRDEDESFMDLFNRTWRRTGVKKKVAQPT